MTTPLTDQSGKSFGNALDLVERLDSVKGMVNGAGGDRQFRMYCLLNKDAIDKLEKSKEFERRDDNTVYHKGYPINYREEGGAPSIQISIALDRRHADIDVDYRSSGFPKALFNGHLSSANSDVRAGSNYDRHSERWTGLQNWWRGFFGVGLKSPPEVEAQKQSLVFPSKPRAGEKPVDEMMYDFLKAWLVDGDVMGAMSYVSERSYACLAEDAEDPATYDRGMAPFTILTMLKNAKDSVVKSPSLERMASAAPITTPGLKEVKQSHYRLFVLYSVPDDIALKFDCENQLEVGNPKTAKRDYGDYYGATLRIAGPQKSQILALLWAKEKDYWKIVSWRVDPEKEPAKEDEPTLVTAPAAPVAKIKADPGLVDAAHNFLDNWLIRKDYDAAFHYLSSRCYPCYDLLRSPDAPASTSAEDAGKKIRANLEDAGNKIGKRDSLDDVISSADPFNPVFRILEQPYSSTFTLVSVPNMIEQIKDCTVRASGKKFTGEMPPEYGKVYAMGLRFKTLDGETPVLRVIWMKENDAWRITAYDIELP